MSLFERSGLDRDGIGRIWDLVALDPSSGRIDRAEFVTAIHLVICVTVRNLPTPKELPECLRRWKEEDRKARDTANVPRERDQLRSSLPKPIKEGRGPVPCAEVDGKAKPTALPSQLPSQLPPSYRWIEQQSRETEVQLWQMENELTSMRCLVKSLVAELTSLRGEVTESKANLAVATDSLDLAKTQIKRMM